MIVTHRMQCEVQNSPDLIQRNFGHLYDVVFPFLQVSATGDPLVPHQDTNIHCDVGKCLEARNLGSKRDPCKRRARPDHACHSSYLQYKMASCDCLKVALRDKFAQKKTLHAHVKCCMYKRKDFKAGGFCLRDHQQSQQRVPFKTRLPV